MAAKGTSGAAEGGQDSPYHGGLDPAHTWRALKGVGFFLRRLPCALTSAQCVFGIVGFSQGCAPSNPGGTGKIGDSGVGDPAGLALACDTRDRGGRVLVRGGGGRPVSIGKGKNIVQNLVRRSISTHSCKEIGCSNWRSDIELEDLPVDILRKIFSKLHFNEVVRTSVLSRKWRHMWMISSRLYFDCIAIFGQRRYFSDKQKYTQQFIDSVNVVLHQFPSEVVEELGVRVELDGMLVDHLNNWISFSVSHLTKNLALDLLPAEFRGSEDMYNFPFELFDSASISRIQQLQLSYVSFKPGSCFLGFPNLKKLDLHLFGVSRKDFENMLAGCSSLEWLSLSRCCMKDELMVKKPLPRLLYIRIVRCRITKVELHAENLKTFVYHGARVPIDLGQVKQLETAEINLYGITLKYALTELPNVLTGVQNFTLDAYLPLEMPSLLDSICIFSQLKILRLLLLIDCNGTDNVLSLASFLRAAPFIEELEMHFDISCLEGVGWGTFQRLPHGSYNYLRNVLITGFNGIKGQLEFLVHIVESAPSLMVLTIDPRKKAGLCLCKDTDCMASRAAARRHLDGKISPSTEVHIL